MSKKIITNKNGLNKSDTNKKSVNINVNNTDLSDTNVDSSDMSQKSINCINVSSNKNYQLSQQIKDEINMWLLKFPSKNKNSVLLHALKIIQAENNGYLTNDLIRALALYINIPAIRVYEVATFYNMFDTKKVGKYKIFICTNIACKICNCSKIVEYIKSKLGINFGQTTNDNKFTLKEAECLGACSNAPVMMIENKYYEKLTEQKVDEILKEYGFE